VVGNLETDLVVVTGTPSNLLTALLPEWQRMLQGWAADGSLTAAAQEALVLNGAPKALTDLTTQWSAGVFTGIPEIVLLSGADMNGAMGAYAISTGKIYLNADWLATATKDQVFAVLTEELGHHLDEMLNSIDTPGDEGEYFARVLAGEILGAAEKDSLRKQNDSTSVMINKLSVIAEGALVGNSSVTVNGAALQIANDPTNKIQLLSVDNGFGSSWWNTPIDLSKDWSSSFNVAAFNGSGTSDGFTFAINGDSRGLNAIGDGGQNLGFFGYNSMIGVSNSYAVLFDMWVTQPASLIGFAPSSTTTFFQSSLTAPISLTNNAYDVFISYLASTKNLSVTLGGQTFSQDIDLQATVGNKAYLGFTAANGGGTMDIDVSNWDVTSSEYITTPIIRSNSVYRTVDGSSWTQAETNAVNIGGHLTSIQSATENSFIMQTLRPGYYGYWIGLSDFVQEGIFRWSDGSLSNFVNWGTNEPSNYSYQDAYGPYDLADTTEDFVHINYTGTWGTMLHKFSYVYPGVEISGIAEVPITSSTTFSPAAREAQTLTTTIALSAGTQATSNLVENAIVYWKVEGITADDLESTSPNGLTGSGTIVNGQLVLNHALKVDGVVENENFQVSVYSDAAMTAEVQIATTQSVAIQDTPLIRGNSIYTLVDGPSWTDAEAASVKLGGHLASIQDQQENNVVSQVSQLSPDPLLVWIGGTDAAVEGDWRWVTGEPWGFTNWSPGEPTNNAWGAGIPENYLALYKADGTWNDNLENNWAEYTTTKGIAETPFIRRGDSAYLIVEGPTWEEAEANAVKLGGHLVTINDAAENEWLIKTYPNQPDWFVYWTGLNDAVKEGEFSWISGEISSFANWRAASGPNRPIYDTSVDINDYVVLQPNNLNESIAGQWSELDNTYFVTLGSTQNVAGIAEIQLSPNNAPTGTPALIGTFKAGQTISIDKSSIQDADNFTGWTPTYTYAWEVSSNNGSTWSRLTSADATDNNSTYTLTVAEVGKKVRGVVGYMDGHGTNEVLETGSAAILTSDTIPPTISSITTQASTVILKFTEAVSAQSVPTYAFTVATISSTNVPTNRAISSVAIDPSNPTQVILTLTGTAPASTDNLIVSYTDLLGNQVTGIAQDLSGNDAASFSRYADTFVASATATIASQYQKLILSGSTAINGTGNDLNNTITGNSANNILDGLIGADTLIGDLGNDTYVIDNTGDRITEASGGGTDTVQSTISYTLGVNLENLKLTGSATINGTGNALNNTITGNVANNILSGGAGADTLIGGLGNDTYVIDNVGDVIIEALGAGTDTVKSSVTYTLGANLENLILTGSASISCTGNALNDTITGNAGNNTLNGGAGADTLIGGLGNDTYVVDNVGDRITEATGAGTDTVQTSVTYTLSANVETLVLTGAAAINGTGNALNNTITGNAGNNTLNGGMGADTLIGGLGNDTYVVDNIGDRVTEGSNAGIDTVQSTISYTLGTNLEHLTLTGSAAVDGTGNALNNVITGNAGNNKLNGGAGADTMIGGLGNDTYVVDNAGDVVTEGLNAGTDTVQSTISYTLGANLEKLTLTGTAAINGFGNALNNTIIGNAANNILRGGAGLDVLTGLGSSDIFQFALADSRLGAIDRITDLTIGTDWIDGPSMVFAENVKQFGSASTLTQKGIAAMLTSSAFLRNQAATFTFGDNTYVALNDGTSGYNSVDDGLVDITGYAGNLNNLAIL